MRMNLRGGRTGKRAVMCEHLELENLTFPFDLEIWYGDRVAVLGANGTGKSHFLRLLAAGGTRPGRRRTSRSTGRRSRTSRTPARRGSAPGCGPGHFSQTHDRPELLDRTLVEILWRGDDHRSGMDRAGAMKALNRYELAAQGDQRFGTLSGGQQARFLVLLLELSGATVLLLDEPTDNLDLASAEALEEGLQAFEGTVIAVTHDRWFTRSLRPVRAVPGRRRGRGDPRAGLGRALARFRQRTGYGPVTTQPHGSPVHRAERGAERPPTVEPDPDHAGAGRSALWCLFPRVACRSPTPDPVVIARRGAASSGRSAATGWPSRSGSRTTSPTGRPTTLTAAVLAICRPAGRDVPGQRPAARGAGGRRRRRARRRRRPAGRGGAAGARARRRARRDLPRPGRRRGRRSAAGATLSRRRAGLRHDHQGRAARPIGPGAGSGGRRGGARHAGDRDRRGDRRAVLASAPPGAYGVAVVGAVADAADPGRGHRASC